ncbi:hypothetical protein [Pedobacter rhodius]|uniref:Lipoprotein n=1 Tax=Pedobacter rhodius TaxID=3004098 RepID=A0ABT4L1L9_9SPHI|nr:hypothetical protein [Pedobacter sp. SJ11]MCZ4223978.1 hypothetical protein [Pedobacter sp. SJ11]
MKKLTIILLLFCAPTLVSGCKQHTPKSKEQSIQPETKKIEANTPADDEKDFRAVFKSFQKEVAAKNSKLIQKLMHFPFYTSQQQLQNGEVGSLADPVTATEFDQYSKAIYHTEVVKLLPKSTEENLSEIDDKTTEPYYQSIKKITEPKSKLYEVYIQYPESNTQAESYFAFVFGKINGKYKAVAYYAKWPVK